MSPAERRRSIAQKEMRLAAREGPGLEVEIGERVRPAIYHEIQGSWVVAANNGLHEIEVGGYLLANQHTPLRIEEATGPGPGWRAGPNVLVLGHTAAEAAAHEPYAIAVGIWHVHPGIGETDPSDEDKERAAEEAHASSLGMWVTLIVSPPAEGGYEFADLSGFVSFPEGDCYPVRLGGWA